MNRTFEAIEDMVDMIPPDFEALVVIVSADFALRHDRSSVEILWADVFSDGHSNARSVGRHYTAQRA